MQVVASVFPFTPGGAGVQQALLLTIFAGNPDVAAFSVGQQIATAVLSGLLGFAALVLIFRFKSFRRCSSAGASTAGARRWRRDSSERVRPCRALVDPRVGLWLVVWEGET